MNTYTPAPTIEEDFVNLVRLELNDIKHSFFKIGFRLREANNNKYYAKLGFGSIEECAETLFGFGKTTTYDLIRISQMFANKNAPMILDTPYEDYSQSQLVLFSQVNLSQRNFIQMAKPTDTISKLRKAKKYWSMIQKGKLQNFLGWGRCKNFDEFIERVEECNPQLLTSNKESEQIIKEKNSGYPENQENKIPEETTEIITESQETISEWDKKNLGSYNTGMLKNVKSYGI